MGWFQGLMPKEETFVNLVADQDATLVDASSALRRTIISAGGRHIVHTLGSKITRLTSIFTASLLGIPGSTTQTISRAIVGVGASRRVSAVRWNVAKDIVIAWVLTLPAAALVSALTFWVWGLFT